MGGEDGWGIDDCCIVAYLLNSVNERTIFPPQLFFTQEAAVDAMDTVPLCVLNIIHLVRIDSLYY